MLRRVVCGVLFIACASVASSGDVAGMAELVNRSSSTGLESAASGSPYRYDKLRYRSDVYSGHSASPYSNVFSPPYDTNPIPVYSPKEPEPYVTQNCYGKPVGLFGNTDNGCKSFSVCQADGRLDIMDCPAFLKFNNYLAVCDWPYKIDASCNPLFKEEYTSNFDNGKGYYVPEGRYEKPYDKPYYPEKPTLPSPYPTLPEKQYRRQYDAPASYGYGSKRYYPTDGPATVYGPSVYAAPNHPKKYSSS